MSELSDKKAVERELKKRKSRRQWAQQKEEGLLKGIEKTKSEINNFKGLQEEVVNDVKAQLSKVEEDYDELALFVTDEQVAIAKIEENIAKFEMLIKQQRLLIKKKKESIADHEQYLPGHEKKLEELKAKLSESEGMHAPKIAKLQKELEKYERRLRAHRSNNSGLLAKPQAS